jgi:DNA-binding NarL/FixJ family response regulator
VERRRALTQLRRLLRAGLHDHLLEVLRLIAGGRNDAEIAGRLVVSRATVKAHVANILRKLPVRDRVQAVVFAYEHGIVEPDRSRA